MIRSRTASRDAQVAAVVVANVGPWLRGDKAAWEEQRVESEERGEPAACTAGSLDAVVAGWRYFLRFRSTAFPSLSAVDISLSDIFFTVIVCLCSSSPIFIVMVKVFF